VAEERFGDAILSTYPMRLIKKDRFLRETRFSTLESRGALWVEVDFHGALIQIVNTLTVSKVNTFRTFNHLSNDSVTGSALFSLEWSFIYIIHV
jgi:endonuclease/exonuclease/phosphatase family metal-dependent hydrolase